MTDRWVGLFSTLRRDSARVLRLPAFLALGFSSRAGRFSHALYKRLKTLRGASALTGVSRKPVKRLLACFVCFHLLAGCAFPQSDFFRHDLLNCDGLIANNQIGIAVRVVFPTKAQVMQTPGLVGITCSRKDEQTSFGGVLVKGLDLLLGKITGV